MGDGSNDWRFNACIFYGSLFYGCGFLRYSQQEKMRSLFLITFLLSSCGVGKVYEINPIPKHAISAKIENADKNKNIKFSANKNDILGPNKYDYRGPTLWFLVILSFVLLFSSFLAYILNKKWKQD